jgi:hypothetical protein
MKRLVSHLLEPRSIILGITVFYFSQALVLWNRSEVGEYHREIFIAGVLLTAALGSAINRVWSNLLAAIMSSQLPFALFAEFWFISQNAEVAIFSSAHIRVFIRAISSSGAPLLLWLATSTVILAYSVVSILRRNRIYTRVYS